MTRRSWLWVAVVTGVVVCGVIWISGRLISGAVAETYSSGMHSSSSEVSRQRGVLFAKLDPDPSTIQCDGVTNRIIDAWIESQTHVIYRFYLFPREIVDSAYYLIVNASIDSTVGHGTCDIENLRYNGSGQFDGEDRSWLAVPESPFRGKLTITVVPSS